MVLKYKQLNNHKMLKNRIKGKIYEDLVPTVIIRKSRRRININKIVEARLTKMWKRELDLPIMKNNQATISTLNKNYKYSKGGYALAKNGVPLNNNGINALKRI